MTRSWRGAFAELSCAGVKSCAPRVATGLHAQACDRLATTSVWHLTALLAQPSDVAAAAI